MRGKTFDDQKAVKAAFLRYLEAESQYRSDQYSCDYFPRVSMDIDMARSQEEADQTLRDFRAAFMAYRDGRR